MGGLFSKPNIPAPPPPPEPPKPTPMVDESAIMKKKKDTVARAQQRGGRMSTILSDGETLG